MTPFRARILLCVLPGFAWIMSAISPPTVSQTYDTRIRVVLLRRDTSAEILATEVLPAFDRILRELSALEHSRSTTETGRITLDLYLKRDADPAAVAAQVREAAYRIYEGIGGRLERPQVHIAGDRSEYMSVWSLFTDGGGSPDRQSVEDRLVWQIERVQGVARVDVFGGSREEIYVSVPTGLLRTYALTPQDVSAGLRLGELIASVGRLDDGLNRTALVYDSRARTLAEIASNTLSQVHNMRHAGLPGGTTRLVASVPDRIVRMDGLEHIHLGVVADGTRSITAMSRELTQLFNESNLSPGVTATPVFDGGAIERSNMRRDVLFYTSALASFLLCLLILGNTVLRTGQTALSILCAFALVQAVTATPLASCTSPDLLPHTATGLFIATVTLHSGLLRLEVFSLGLTLALSLLLQDPAWACVLRVYLLAHGAMRITWPLSQRAVYARREASAGTRWISATPLLLLLLTLPAPVFLILVDNAELIEDLHLDIDAYASAEAADSELQAAAAHFRRTLSPTFVQTQARRGSGSLRAGFHPHTDRNEVMQAIQAFNSLERRGRLIPRADELPGTVHRVPMYATAPTAETAHATARLAAREAGDAVLHFREDSERVVLRPHRIAAHTLGVDLGQATLLLQSIISPAVHHKRIVSGRETDVRVEIRPPTTIPPPSGSTVHIESLLDTASVTSLTGDAVPLSSAFYPSRERRPDVLTHADRNPSAHFSLFVAAPSMREAVQRAEQAVSRVTLPRGGRLRYDPTSASAHATTYVHPPAVLLSLYASVVFLLAACVEESWSEGLKSVVYTGILVTSMSIAVPVISQWDSIEIAGYPGMALLSAVTVLRLRHMHVGAVIEAARQRLRISSRCRAIRCIFR